MLLGVPARSGSADLLGDLLNPGGACTPQTCGSFAAPFVEPTLAGQSTAEKCLTDAEGELICRPAAASWTQPTPVDGGANPGGTANTPLLPGLNTNDEQGAGALFCSHLVQLADGRILAAGGTNYYLEPGIEPIPFGISELEGLKNTRIFNPADDHWAQTDSMTYGRWYPTLTTLPPRVRRGWRAVPADRP